MTSLPPNPEGTATYIPDRSELFELLGQLFAEEITAAQMERIEQLMIDDPGARNEYCRQVDIHLGLRSLAKVRPLRESEENTTQTVLMPDVGYGWWQPKLVFALLLSIGFCLLVLGLISSFMTRENVVLTQSAGAVLFREATPIRGGAMLYHHEYSLIEGLIELRFPSGATAVLGAPAVIEIKDSDLLNVKIGSCSVHAPPGAEGFRVITPKAEVVDLGTRFFVGVQEGGQTDVHVVEGEAEIRNSDGTGSSQFLIQHQARRLTGVTEIVSSELEFRADEYVGELPDRIISYQAQQSKGPHVSRLMSVDVQRDGKLKTYQADELIGVKVTHFCANNGKYCLMNTAGQSSGRLALRDRLSVLESDSLLNTGVTNAGGAPEPLTMNPNIASLNQSAESDPGLTPGLGIEFRSPVINSAGPDLVFFELQSATEPLEGDAFHVSPLKFRSGLRSTTIQCYDISMLSPEANALEIFDLYVFDSVPKSLHDLLTVNYRVSVPQYQYYALAVGVDLSDLGYKIGESATALFFQDAYTDHSTFDPVFIGGLPPIDQ